jgi:hypothetical protein
MTNPTTKSDRWYRNWPDTPTQEEWRGGIRERYQAQLEDMREQYGPRGDRSGRVTYENVAEQA